MTHSHLFNLKWGVHQGDPLSPSLFIIVLELRTIFVRNNDQISGIVVDGNPRGDSHMKGAGMLMSLLGERGWWSKFLILVSLSKNIYLGLV